MELALDVNVIMKLTFGLFVVWLVAAFARSVVAVACRGRLRIPTKGRAEMRRAKAKASAAEAVVAEAEAVVAAEQLRLQLGGT